MCGFCCSPVHSPAPRACLDCLAPGPGLGCASSMRPQEQQQQVRAAAGPLLVPVACVCGYADIPQNTLGTSMLESANTLKIRFSHFIHLVHSHSSRSPLPASTGSLPQPDTSQGFERLTNHYNVAQVPSEAALDTLHTQTTATSDSSCCCPMWGDSCVARACCAQCVRFFTGICSSHCLLCCQHATAGATTCVVSGRWCYASICQVGKLR